MRNEYLLHNLEKISVTNAKIWFLGYPNYSNMLDCNFKNEANTNLKLQA
jgi:hypothetical protein